MTTHGSSSSQSHSAASTSRGAPREPVGVSVVIPAYNAADTLAETIESLRAQTFASWEAVVVDDGSADTTSEVAAGLSARDSRIRVVDQPNGGVSAARNTGVAHARHDWLLFLDADDWLAPEHLERMAREIDTTPDLDAVHCGWVRIAPDGTRVGEHACRETGDMFPTLARRCAFAIHSCVVRKSLVEAVGGFDASLATCEDWDLWQRVARAGARFGRVDEVLALYRMRSGVVATSGRRFLVDGLRVIAQGHGPDPRVSHPVPAHAGGLPARELASVRLHFASWPAGLVIGNGEDARPLLELLDEDRDPSLDPSQVADCIFEAALLPSCRPPSEWPEVWPDLRPRIDEFLRALESRSGARGLAGRAARALERKIRNVGATHAVRIDVTEPIPDVSLPASAELLMCEVDVEGTRLGTIELPVCDGLVPSSVLADAVAAEFAWQILGAFFERTLYRELRTEKDADGVSVWRGDVRLATGPAEDTPALRLRFHDRVGWTVFLQEIWGRPAWPMHRFYEPGSAKEKAPKRRSDAGWIALEASEDPADCATSGATLNVVPTVGGAALGVVSVPVNGGVARAGEIRAAVTTASGFELCRAAVREGLLGGPLEGAPLRERLATAATRAGRDSGDDEAARDGRLAPGSARALERAPRPGEVTLVLGRRGHAAIGTSASRRAALPAAAASALADAAAAAGEPAIMVPPSDGAPDRVVYAPEVFWRSDDLAVAGEDAANTAASSRRDDAPHGRAHFETLFATSPNPWKYTTPYEQTKYEQTLSLLPSGPVGRALELACAEGHFTAQLAPRVGSLVAADISQIALDRAAERCAGLSNVDFVRLDLVRDPIPGRYDLIVCSEVLYYMGGRSELKAVARKLADALEPGGHLLAAHAHVIADDPQETGFDWDVEFGARTIGETLEATRPLRLVKELRTPLYSVQLFRREAGVRAHLPLFGRQAPERVDVDEIPPLEPNVAASVSWRGGRGGAKPPAPVVTERLPILAYHRIARPGAPETARYAVRPDAFEEQLRYLRDAGYYGVDLERWRAAADAKRGLPGRAVLITFDDGYKDFLTHAWPLLKRYGFSALVFLVAGEVGRSNAWDRAYGEEVPLMGWDEIRSLQAEGARFGSHSITHPPLTSLSPEEVAREAAGSRVILERELGRPVRAFAYPYGEVDPAVRHLVGACGYVFGLSCRTGASGFNDPLLSLPRIEVAGSDSLRDFVAKLGGGG